MLNIRVVEWTVVCMKGEVIAAEVWRQGELQLEFLHTCSSRTFHHGHRHGEFTLVLSAYYQIKA